MVEAFAEFNLLLVSSSRQFCFVSVIPKLFEICHVFEGLTSCLYIMILSCILLTKVFGTLSTKHH